MLNEAHIARTASRTATAARIDRGLDILGRAGIALLFCDAARYHLTSAGWDRTLADMAARGVPAAKPLLLVAMAASIGLSLALLLGIQQRRAALALSMYTISVSLVMYNPFANLGQTALIFLLKDICIFGALLALSRALKPTGWRGYWETRPSTTS